MPEERGRSLLPVQDVKGLGSLLSFKHSKGTEFRSKYQADSLLSEKVPLANILTSFRVGAVQRASAIRHAFQLVAHARDHMFLAVSTQAQTSHGALACAGSQVKELAVRLHDLSKSDKRVVAEILKARLKDPLCGKNLLHCLQAPVKGVVTRVAEQLADLNFSVGRQAQVQAVSWEVQQGDTLVLLVKVPPLQGPVDNVLFMLRGMGRKGPILQVTWDGVSFPAYPLNQRPDTWRVLVPTTPLDVPGPRNLVVDVKDGRHRTFRQVVDLKKREFPTESIWLPDHVVGRKGTRKEMAEVAALCTVHSPFQHWQLPLLEPSGGPVTTGYGLQRYYNGVFAQGYYHRGIDYGAWVGEPVSAPAGGRVLLTGWEAEGFEVHGNCVGLDHGRGVVSLLMHLDSIAVRKGDEVKAGDLVGTVGSSGIATGPHLHWGLYVSGECVDPAPWLESQSWM